MLPGNAGPPPKSNFCACEAAAKSRKRVNAADFCISLHTVCPRNRESNDSGQDLGVLQCKTRLVDGISQDRSLKPKSRGIQSASVRSGANRGGKTAAFCTVIR